MAHPLKKTAIDAICMDDRAVRWIGPRIRTRQEKDGANMKCLLPAVALSVFCGFVQSQCPSDDGFTGATCCTPVAPPFAAFPQKTFPGVGACLLDCGPENQFPITATFTPFQVLCDHWLMNVSINAPGNFTIINQLLVAKYARTWIETEFFAGPPIQVWRFLVNGDLTYAPSATATPGCPIPLSALPPHNLPVHFVGHLDFAFHCVLGIWEGSYSLSHFCPSESHAPFSQRPIPAAAGWPKRTYHFVGPGGFDFNACQAPRGVLLAESARTSTGLAAPVGPYTCLRETLLAQGDVSLIVEDCACSDTNPSAPARYSHQSLTATETCVTASAMLSSVPVPLAAIPTGFRALVLGSYVATPGFIYPGTRCVSVYLGLLDAPGVCAGPTPHIVTGVGTTFGFPQIFFNAPAIPPFFPLGMIDLQDMLVLTPFGFFPGLGSLFASERVWNLVTLHL
jgi:hypothetical protein